MPYMFRPWASYSAVRSGNLLMFKGYARVFNQLPDHVRDLVQVTYGFDGMNRETVVKFRIANKPKKELTRKVTWPNGGQFILEVPVSEEDIAYLCLVA